MAVRSQFNNYIKSMHSIGVLVYKLDKRPNMLHNLFY